MNNLPKNELEKALEIKILRLIRECVENDMTFGDVLAVLERVRHLTTEIMISVGYDFKTRNYKM